MIEAVQTKGYAEAPIALFRLAMYYNDYRKEGRNREQAREAFCKFVEKWPNSYLASKARGYIDRLDRERN